MPEICFNHRAVPSVSRGQQYPTITATAYYEFANKAAIEKDILLTAAYRATPDVHVAVVVED
jgi:hypothetical protein